MEKRQSVYQVVLGKPYKSLASVTAALESVCQNPTSVGNVPAFLLSDQDVGCLRGVTRSSRLSAT